MLVKYSLLVIDVKLYSACAYIYIYVCILAWTDICLLASWFAVAFRCLCKKSCQRLASPASAGKSQGFFQKLIKYHHPKNFVFTWQNIHTSSRVVMAYLHVKDSRDNCSSDMGGMIAGELAPSPNL